MANSPSFPSDSPSELKPAQQGVALSDTPGIETVVAFEKKTVTTGTVRALNFDPHHHAIVVARGDARVFAYGNITVYASEQARVHVFKGATLIAAGSATGRAYEYGEVAVFDQATVEVHDRRNASATGSATVTAYDEAVVMAMDMATAHVFGQSRGVMRGLASVVTHENAEVHCYGNSHAEIYGGTVILHEASHGDLYTVEGQDVHLDEENGGLAFDGGHIYVTSGNTINIIPPEERSEQEERLEVENRELVDEIIPQAPEQNTAENHEFQVDDVLTPEPEQDTAETHEFRVDDVLTPEPEQAAAENHEFQVDDVLAPEPVQDTPENHEFQVDEVLAPEPEQNTAENHEFQVDEVITRPAPFNYSLGKQDTSPDDPNGYLTFDRTGNPTRYGESGVPERNEDLNFGLGASTDPASPKADVADELAIPQLQALGWTVLTAPTGPYQPFETMTDAELKKRTEGRTAQAKDKPKQKRAGFSF